MTTATIGLIGLAVMGQNLVLNMERNGYTVAVFNRTTAVTEEFVAAHPGKKLVPARTLEEFVASLEKPRRILIMVKAGAAVDAVIDGLVPLLDTGDLIMDGGNSFYADTDRRSQALALAGLQLYGRGRLGRRGGGALGAQHYARRHAQKRGRSSPTCWRPSPPRRRKMASPVSPILAPAAPATTSRWCTTASSTATCS